jgi:hypothetical protein
MTYEAIKDLRTGRITLEPSGRRLVRGLEVYMARMTDPAVLRKLYPAAEDRTAPNIGHNVQSPAEGNPPSAERGGR